MAAKEIFRKVAEKMLFDTNTNNRKFKEAAQLDLMFSSYLNSENGMPVPAE